MKVKIGELAKMTGCEVVTIRYYEKEGLLKKPERTEGRKPSDYPQVLTTLESQR